MRLIRTGKIGKMLVLNVEIPSYHPKQTPQSWNDGKDRWYALLPKYTNSSGIRTRTYAQLHLLNSTHNIKFSKPNFANLTYCLMLLMTYEHTFIALII